MLDDAVGLVWTTDGGTEEAVPLIAGRALGGVDPDAADLVLLYDRGGTRTLANDASSAT